MAKAAAMVLAAIAAGSFALGFALAGTFPDHPIKVIVAYPPGGPNDTLARIAAQGLGVVLGQSVFIENVPGAGGRIGSRDVARAVPDGYTLLAGGSNNNAIAAAIYKNLDFDPLNDFSPVASVSAESTAVVVNPSVPAASLADLVRYGKQHPGKLTSGSTLGIAPHLLLEFIRARTGIDMLFVPYKGAAPAIADALGNQIQVAASGKSVLLPLIRAGRLRAIVVSGAERWPELPDVPTLHESGLIGFPTAVWDGLVAPAGTPHDVINKLNAAANTGLKSPETIAALAKLGMQPHTLSPEQFTAALTEQVKEWRAVAQETRISLD